MSEGVTVSDDGMAATRGRGYAEWQCALAEEAVDTGGRAYAEWVIEEADADCQILLGVTALEAVPPAGTNLFDSHESSMFCCNAWAWPGCSVTKSVWSGCTDRGGRRRKGDRVGLLVDGGQVWVFVNGARLGSGPMASYYRPARVRFAVEMRCAGSRVRVVAGAAPPV